MAASMKTVLNLVLISVLVSFTSSLPRFLHGRPKHGLLGAPKLPQGSVLPPDMWLKQKLTHFNYADTRTWQQVSFFTTLAQPSHSQIVTAHFVTYSLRYYCTCILQRKYLNVTYSILIIIFFCGSGISWMTLFINQMGQSFSWLEGKGLLIQHGCCREHG